MLCHPETIQRLNTPSRGKKTAPKLAAADTKRTLSRPLTSPARKGPVAHQGQGLASPRSVSTLSLSSNSSWADKVRGPQSDAPLVKSASLDPMAVDLGEVKTELFIFRTAHKYLDDRVPLSTTCLYAQTRSCVTAVISIAVYSFVAQSFFTFCRVCKSFLYCHSYFWFRVLPQH